MERKLIGAWATSASDCAALFERRADHWVFRQPVDRFAQAAIIEPGRILAPSNSCEVKDVTRAGDVISVSAVCSDSVSYMNQTARVTVKSDDAIIYSPNGDPALNTNLQRCAQ